MRFAVVTRDACSWCLKVKDELRKYSGIMVFEYNLHSHPDLLEFIKAAGFKTVPIVFHEGQLIGGYEQTVEYLKEIFGE